MSQLTTDDAVLESVSREVPRPAKVVSNVERYLMRRLLAAIGQPPISVTLWDGQEYGVAHGYTLARVRIHERKTLWKLALDPLFEFGEAYADGTLEVDGDLSALLAAVNRGLFSADSKPSFSSKLLEWLHAPRRNTLAGSRKNIHHHYDLGNDFYKLWLDDELVYTCAYYPHPNATLEEAQIAKMDHVCKKVGLVAGQTVVEAGCGWGALARFMAKRYGVNVKAFNISKEQLAYARERARQEGLADRVEFIDGDWREIKVPCDAFVSVGMLEHVGAANYAQLGRVIDRCLRPNGRGLIHSIGQNQARLLNPWIERNIFPGAYPPTLRQCMNIFEPHAFSVLDVENLRMHYAQTLRHWLERFERAVETVRKDLGARFERMWRLYLIGSIAGFESGSLQLFQIAFARGRSNEIPWTRAGWYT
jgi:cyclopropane-fatty-acyl-phospholipid synthase